MSFSSSSNQDFELNLAPIIDCLTVLITFMLASATFLSIGILDAGVAAGGSAAATEQAPPPVNLTIELGHDKNFVLKVTGKENRVIPIAQTTKGVPAGTAANYDYETLLQQLAQVEAKWPTVKAITLSADNSVEYEDVVRAMDSIRKTIPVVLLGGF
ncbi:MAG: biopolymer transporter ExbD [Oligoflexia bacterium]|nr:biopolymer transporter ExbD [Oligoflexia bacterium]